MHSIDTYFPHVKYPEFIVWEPVLDLNRAGWYVNNSTIQSTLFHVTFPDRAESIIAGGVDPEKCSWAVEFAMGHYMAVNSEYADRFGHRVLRQKALIKNPFRVVSSIDYRVWQAKKQILGFGDHLIPKLSRLELLEEGFDGMHIITDTIGEPESESWLAFHPKQVVTLIEQ